MGYEGSAHAPDIKLYAKGDAKRQFTDIQAYNRAHGQDIKRRSKKEGK
jgi:hypothetical protein